jgi:hypothetical protein
MPELLAEISYSQAHGGVAAIFGVPGPDPEVDKSQSVRRVGHSA